MEIYINYLVEIKTGLLIEFETRTLSYGPSFFPNDLWPKRKARGL